MLSVDSKSKVTRGLNKSDATLITICHLDKLYGVICYVYSFFFFFLDDHVYSIIIILIDTKILHKFLN